MWHPSADQADEAHCSLTLLAQLEACLAVRVAGAAEVAQLGAWLAVHVAGATEVAQLGAWLAVCVAGAVQLSTPAASE